MPHNFRIFIGGVLLGGALMNLTSSIVWVFSGDERWFSRFALAMILLGLWYAGNKDE